MGANKRISGDAEVLVLQPKKMLLILRTFTKQHEAI